MQLPSALYTCDQVKALDQYAIEQFAVSGFELMKRAGLAAFQLLCESWPQVRKLTVLCGGGNNGGDGYIVAGLAAEQGFEVDLICVSDPQLLRGDALLACQFARDSGLSAVLASADQLDRDWSDSVVVDALLGIGLRGNARDVYATAIASINNGRPRVLSIDIPSGLNGDTGAVLGCAVRADKTISYIGLKRGLFTAQGKSHTGELYFDDLALDPKLYISQKAAVHRLEFELPLLPPRNQNSHKGNFGRLLVIGGGNGMGGASIMSAESALISGAGCVHLLTDKRYINSALSRCPELMVMDRDDLAVARSLIEQSNALVVGPGLGEDTKAEQLLRMSIESARSIVIDAQGLGLLSRTGLYNEHWVLTPHPGEAASLLNITTAEVQANRFEILTELQARYGGVVILKGAGTLIGDGNNIWLCDKGNPAMSAPGVGDVLAGMLGALLAQGYSLVDASMLGVWAHAHAGDAAALQLGRHLLATDLYPYIRQVW